MEYDPNEFRHDFRSSSKIKKHASNISSDNYENFDQNETATLADTSEEGAYQSAVTVTTLDRNLESSFLILNPQKDENSFAGVPIIVQFLMVLIVILQTKAPNLVQLLLMMY